MLKKSGFLILILVSTCSASLAAQDEIAVPGKGNSSLSLYTALGLGWHTNFSYSYLSAHETVRVGFTGGWTLMVLEGVTSGPHLTFDLVAGRGRHCFDSKFGLAYPLDDNVTYFEVIPVISLGYRYRNPNGKNFFRAGLSTAGIGVGFGINLGVD